ncbi:MAG: DUF3857 domain-containing protein [Anaeromyxobacter sp.]
MRPTPVLLALLAAPALALGAPFDVGPAPAWVIPERADLAAAPPADLAGGVDYLLVDEQVNATGPVERYRHLVMRVLSPSGVENASEVSTSFDPAYERLVLHGVWVIRDGQRRQALRARDVRVMQREQELERRLFDGTLTAMVVVPDVRPGDLVEYAYTVRGQNPVFEGRFLGGYDLGWETPVGRISVRMLWPDGKPLRHRAEGLSLTPQQRPLGDGTTELRWTIDHAPGIEDEGDLPAGVDPFPSLELSGFERWADVVAWALPLYAHAPPTPAMEERLRAWRALPDPVARAGAALRFVQDDVRYLGFEVGMSSHRPHPPGEVFERRFGDCKDKSLLLVTLLTALGIEAAPALVNTGLGTGADRHLPSPGLFDHVIVRAVVDGKPVWVDPTRSLERGLITELAPPRFRRALLVRRGETALTAMPDPRPARVTAKTTYRIPRFSAPGSLEVVTTLEGSRAVAMRHTLAESRVDDLQKEYLDHYVRDLPGLEVARPMEVADAPDADRITLTERYVLPPVRKGEKRDFSADAVHAELQAPERVLRKFPLGVRHPVEVHEELRIELPGEPDIEGNDERVVGPAARLERHARVDGHALVVTYDYRSLGDTVPAGQVTRHLDRLKEMQDLAGFNVPLSVVSPPLSPRPAAKREHPGSSTGPAGWIATGVVLGVCASLAGSWLLGGRRRRAAAAPPPLGAVEAPREPPGPV